MNQDREKIREEWREYNTTLQLKGLTITEEGTAEWWLDKMSLAHTDTLQKVDEIVGGQIPYTPGKTFCIHCRKSADDHVNQERARILSDLSSLRTIHNQK